MQLIPQKFKTPLKSLIIVVMVFALFLANAAHDACPNESFGWEYTISFFIPPLLLVTLATLVWGLFQYLVGRKQNNGHTKEFGKSLLIWGLFMFVWLVIFWGIIGYVRCSM